jgi:hypothetical protein
MSDVCTAREEMGGATCSQPSQTGPAAAEVDAAKGAQAAFWERAFRQREGDVECACAPLLSRARRTRPHRRTVVQTGRRRRPKIRVNVQERWDVRRVSDAGRVITIS